ncbi:hypothetical protein LQZ18_04115 [Lachnospiraceae bacterium ZAX-1]
MRKCKGSFYDGFAHTKFEDGLFHCFGLVYDEIWDEIATYSVALVELSDGRIVKVLPEHVQFLPEEKGKR